MKCSGCGITLPEKIVLCPSCGYSIKDQHQSNYFPAQQNQNSGRITPAPSNGFYQPGLNHSHIHQGTFVGAPAGFWLRLAAYLIDYLLISFAAFIVGAIYGLALDESMGVLILTIILGPWFYEAGMTASKVRGTIGKRVVGLQVLSDSGEQLTFGLASGRYWLKVVTMVLTLGLITVPAGIRKDRKAGYDILSKTNVYRK